MTPYNRSYSLITDELGLIDSHITGSGLGLTFPSGKRRVSALGPLMRLDYIFTRGFTPVKSITVEASDESDHLAVITDFVSLSKDSET